MASATPNPFPLIRAAATEAVYGIVPQSFFNQLSALTAIYAVIIALYFAALGIRYSKSGELWLVRRLITPNGSFYIPHRTSFFATLLVIFAILGLILTRVMIGIYHEHDSQIGFFLWQTVVWLPLPIACFYHAYASVCNADFSRLATRLFTLESTLPSFVKFLPSPVILNTFLLMLPFLIGGPIIVPAIVGNSFFDHAFKDYELLDQTAATAAALFNGTVDPEVLGALSYIKDDFLAQVKEATHWAMVTFTFYSIFGGILFFASTAFFWILGLKLRQQLNLLRRASIREKEGQIPPEKPSFESRAIKLAKIYREFAISGIAIMFLTGLYSVLSVTAAIRPVGSSGSFDTKGAVSVRTLTTLWSFGVIGLLLMATIVYSASQETSYEELPIPEPLGFSDDKKDADWAI